jgi:hypothetical protein
VGSYDRTGVYTALDERYPDAVIVVPPRNDAVLSATADTDPTQRDCHIQAITTGSDETLGVPTGVSTSAQGRTWAGVLHRCTRLSQVKSCQNNALA